MTVKDINVPDKNGGDLISRQAAKKKACSICRWKGTDNCSECEHPIDDLPTIDAVPVGAYEQTRWERDTAISQLAEIGKSLCEKMDNVATVVRCKDCKHNYGKEHCEEFNPEDIVCDYWATDGLNDDDFCSYGERSENAD